MSSVTCDVLWKQSDTQNFNSKYCKSYYFLEKLSFSSWTGKSMGRKANNSTLFSAESTHEKSAKGWERAAWSKSDHGDHPVPQGSHCLQPHSHTSREPRGSTAAQGYVQGQKLFGWCICISCVYTHSSSTLGPMIGSDGRNFSARCDPWAMFWTVLI